MAITITKAPPVNEFDKHTAVPVSANGSVIKKNGKTEKMVKEIHETVNPGVMIPEHLLHKLTLEGSHTVNLGNYESAKIGLMLTIPCTKDDLQEAFEWGLAWIGERIQKEVAQAKG
jgi:hypothetical protein